MQLFYGLNLLWFLSILFTQASSYVTIPSGSSHKSLVIEEAGPKFRMKSANKTYEQGQGIDYSNGTVSYEKFCYMAVQVDSVSDKHRRCPKECPLYAEEIGATHCSFMCVKNSVEDCQSVDPSKPVPDVEKGICRACSVSGCLHCSDDGTDSCKECQNGYGMRENGTCYSKTLVIWIGLFIFIFILIIMVILWVVDLYQRPIVNDRELAIGLELRSCAKLHQPKNFDMATGAQEATVAVQHIHHQELPKPSDSKESKMSQESGDASLALSDSQEQVETGLPQRGPARELWPLNTNLCYVPVAGPGLVLDFNFQVVVILWAFAVGIAWLVMAAIVDRDMLILGTRRAETPRQYCILVAWGYETQQELMTYKVHFLIVLYVVSFILSLLHSIRQLRMFQSMDMDHTTHKDFACQCIGLPVLEGDERVEEKLAEVIFKATGQKVVGVSVCWDFSKEEEILQQFVELQMDEREGRSGTILHTPKDDGSTLKTRIFQKIEGFFLHPTTQKIMTKRRQKKYKQHHKLHAKNTAENRRSTRDTLVKAAEKLEEDGGRTIEDMVIALKTSDQAFVIFDSEEARNAAVESSPDGIEFRDATLQLSAARCEPTSVNWRNFSRRTAKDRAIAIGAGVGCILLALIVWISVFYLPYAYYITSFNYSYGQEPGMVQGTTFSMLVVAGNLVMYIVCGEVSDRVGFKYVDTREVCYMLLYSFACIFNVILDLMVTFAMAAKTMEGMNMRTYHGTKLSEVDTFLGLFGTYAMQRELASNLWWYCIPATFLIPFLCEPILSICVPLELKRLIVRSHPGMSCNSAEDLLASTPMDLSRYADILLNLELAVLIFFFPGGYTVTMFLGLCVAHIYIYAIDHYRVLRSVPRCVFASMDVDWWAQWMLCIPLGFLLTCATFKALNNGRHGEMSTSMLLELCVAAFFLHMAVHTLLLLCVVPCFGIKDLVPRSETYEECSTKRPHSWFSANIVHCLRSQFVYGHTPPVDHSIVGKEHLLRFNAEAGQFFVDVKAQSEDWKKSYRSSIYDGGKDVLAAVMKLQSRNSRERSSSEPQLQMSDETSGCCGTRFQPPHGSSDQRQT